MVKQDFRKRNKTPTPTHTQNTFQVVDLESPLVLILFPDHKGAHDRFPKNLLQGFGCEFCLPDHVNGVGVGERQKANGMVRF